MWRKVFAFGCTRLLLPQCHFTVPRLPSSRKTQGFVLKINQKVEIIKSTESPSSTMVVSSSCPRTHSCLGGAVPTLGHSWGQVFTRSCFSLHKLPKYM